MTSPRAYRRPVSRVAAHRELVKRAGRQFDPVVVRAMVGLSAPRLRAAQGLLAWLSDIPMVATGYVPVATMARVVGVGALATGAATGVGLAPTVAAAAGAPAHSDRVSAGSARVVVPSGSTAVLGVSSANNPSPQAKPAGGHDGAAKKPAAAAGKPAKKKTKSKTNSKPTPSTSADPSSGDSASGTGGSDNTGSGDGGSGSTGSDSSGSGNSGSGDSGSGKSESINSGSSNSGSDSSNSGSGSSDSG
jgi:hypothetical protein